MRNTAGPRILERGRSTFTLGKGTSKRENTRPSWLLEEEAACERLWHQ